jgi:predicted metal-binding membrane protein
MLLKLLKAIKYPIMKAAVNNIAGELGSAIGKGILAGIAATAAITISQMIEMKITKRGPSEAPLKVAFQTVGIKPADRGQKQKVSQEIHWSYGTIWGISRGLISLTGLKGLSATLIHFAAIWGTEQVMLPKFNAAPPINKEDAKTIAIDMLHHGVYALTAGLVYDAID